MEHQSYSSRKDFERNIFMVRHAVSRGKLMLGPKVRHVAESLQNVQRLPNGRINLLTINSSVRAVMHGIGQFAEDHLE